MTVEEVRRPVDWIDNEGRCICQSIARLIGLFSHEADSHRSVAASSWSEREASTLKG